MYQKIIKFNRSGFSLVEVLVVMFIASVVFTSFYSVSMIGTRYIIESKNKLGAIAFANEKMEIIRNLKYTDVGIDGGVPNGNVPQDEDVTANGRSFHVHTFIQYVDDPLDGVFPADVIPNDYKSVKVVVSWKDSFGNNQEIDSLSRFVPPGLETNDGGAPLAINVKGSDGSPVKQASVHIVNNAVVPVINFTVQTDDDGHIMIPAAPASLGGYQITVSKSGYETVATADSPAMDYLSQPYTPTYGQVSVLLNTLNMYDYIENKLSNLTIKTTNYQNNPVGSLAFTVNGGKVLGRDAANVDVLNLHNSAVTDVVTGQKEYLSISPGNYDIALTANAQYEFIEHSPAGLSVALVPGTDLTYEVKVADKNSDGLLVNVIDNDTNMPVLDATISLKDNLGADVFVAKRVSANGILYYPDSATPLPAGNYTLKVESPEYVTQDIPVVINKLTKQEVKLIKN